MTEAIRTQGKVIENPGTFPIGPADIDAAKHLFGAFGHSETEVSAGWLVRFCQECGSGWRPISRAGIEGYYNRFGLHGFQFNRLIRPGRAFYIAEGWVNEGGGWIVDDGELLHFTTAFVLACYEASPAVKP